MDSLTVVPPIEAREGDDGIVRALHWGECRMVPGDHGVAPHERGCCVAICTYRRADSVLRLLDSLAIQEPRPRQVVIVDGSPDDDTERALTGWAARDAWPHCLLYLRVGGRLRGLTRQRNVALSRVGTDLVAFFDDDIVLLDGCLRAMEDVHRLRGDVVGVGALIANGDRRPPPLWWVRRLLLLVPSLEPGRYFASGVSTPWWSAGAARAQVMDGDWLPGCATMWRTEAALGTGFVEGFAGYGSGEDLEFSLRVGTRGRLVMAGAACVDHLHEPGGRPDPEELGYAFVRNHHLIHRARWAGRSRGATLWFLYATTAEAMLQSAQLLHPDRARETWRYLRGLARYGREWLTGRRRG